MCSVRDDDEHCQVYRRTVTVGLIHSYLILSDESAASHPHDLGCAAGTGRSEELLVAVLAVDVVLLLHEAGVSQRHVAIVTVKLLGVPGPAESHQEGAPRNNNNNNRLSGSVS